MHLRRLQNLSGGAVALLALLAPLPAPGNPAAGAADEPTVSEATASSILQNALPEEMNTIFPIGREFHGVAIPSYDEDRLQSVMQADTITRIDERYLDLDELFITVYTSAEKEEATIYMKEATYDLVLGMLRSKTPAKIEQSQFTMTGDSMTFDTRAQFSRLRGNVRVIIPDASSLAPSLGFPIPATQ